MAARVLIVDDETPVRRMVGRVLEQIGLETLEAESGSEGLELFLMEAPEVVVTDLKMPGMSGLDLAGRIRENDPDCPVILITAYADLESARQAIEIGVYDYFTKPFDVEDLKAGVMRAVETQELRAEITAHQDNLERKVRERTRELEQACARLIDAERLSVIGRLSTSVVHEILDPLSAASCRMSLLREDPTLSDDARDSLGIAMAQIRTAVKTADSLRIFTSPSRIARERVRLRGLVDRVLNLVTHRCRQAGIQVDRSVENDLFVTGDSDQLSQLILNLVHNAIDAMPAGGRLRLAGGAVGGSAVIRIQDTGPGIPPEDAGRVFEPFYTTKGIQGTGLGLPICRGIAESHDGSLDIESTGDSGTTIVLKLRCGSAEPKSTDGRAAATASQDSYGTGNEPCSGADTP